MDMLVYQNYKMHQFIQALEVSQDKSTDIVGQYPHDPRHLHLRYMSYVKLHIHHLLAILHREHHPLEGSHQFLDTTSW